MYQVTPDLISKQADHLFNTRLLDPAINWFFFLNLQKKIPFGNRFSLQIVKN